MGCDCKITLSGDSRIKDVAKVASILCGGKATLERLTDTAKRVVVSGVKIEFKATPGIPEMATVELSAEGNTTFPDGEKVHYFFYHFEHGNKRLVSVRSTPFWIALGVELARFFGGEVDANDCDNTREDFSFARPRKSNSAEDGEPWQEFQNEIAAVKPLTKVDLNKVFNRAAYSGR